MSNPIRIAQGPPTEEGDYKCRKEASGEWVLCLIDTWQDDEELWLHFTNGGKMRLKNAIAWGWQFSTRIPDPEEMT